MSLRMVLNLSLRHYRQTTQHESSEKIGGFKLYVDYFMECLFVGTLGCFNEVIGLIIDNYQMW